MVLRIGIVGGGIGGLTLAVALSKLGVANNVEVDIYESAIELTQIGAGITVWPRIWKILEKLGLTDELVTQLGPGQHVPDGIPRLAFQFRKADEEEGRPIHDLVFSGSPLSFHRAVVQKVLLNHLSPSIRCHLSRQLVSYTAAASSAPGSIVLTFADGTTASCDILVGADGIKSVVRRQLVRDALATGERPSPALPLDEIASPVWSGTIAYRFMVDSADLPGHRLLTGHVLYCGQNQREPNCDLNYLAYCGVSYSTGTEDSAYVSDLSKEGTKWDGPSFEDVTKEEMIPYFDSWEEEVRILIRNAKKPSRWAIHAIDQLDSFISPSGTVLLLGDAAHAMTPHQGNGAGQAVEDAYILAHLLAKGISSLPPAPIPRIAQIYDEIRRPAANLVHSSSRTNGMLYEFNAPGFTSDEDVETRGTDGPLEQDRGNRSKWPAERLELLGEAIVRGFRYAWETTAEGDRERAIQMLQH